MWIKLPLTKCITCRCLRQGRISRKYRNAIEYMIMSPPIGSIGSRFELIGIGGKYNCSFMFHGVSRWRLK